MCYHLRSVLVGHSEDVRCSTVLPGAPENSQGNVLATGSRDKSIRLWKSSETHQNEFECTSGLIEGHSDYVTALCSLEDLGDGAFVSGSRDATVRVWSRKDHIHCLHVLEGHQYQVTGVVGIPSKNDGHVYVASTSLDGCVRLWNVSGSEALCIGEKKEHDGPVLCIDRCSDDGKCLVTGSGDCTLRLWSIEDGALCCTSAWQGHADTVRSVAYVPSLGIVSGSHDMTVKLWTLDGQCLQTMEGHDALVYSVAVSPDGALIASASEDATVRVWSMNGECLDVIRHPGCVWTVNFLSNGDLISGCADGMARIWSTDEGRKAPADMCEAFEEQVAMYHDKKDAKNGDETTDASKKLKTYSAHVLEQPGTHDGQTIVVEEGAHGVAYSWNQGAGDWERVGEVVMEGLGAGWDFSFDVDIADGQPKIKLQANAGEDAYVVADRFIAENNLPSSYKEQIVQFLIVNTQGKVNINLDTSGSFVDPYTGANAYVPGSSFQGHHGDMTSIGAHENVDPLTGSNVQKSGRFPVKSYVLFSSPLSVDSAMTKLREFNGDISTSQEPLAVSDTEWRHVEGLMALANGGTIESIELEKATLNKLLSWPFDKVFPVLDICRAMLLSENGRNFLKSHVKSIHKSPSEGSLGSVVEGLLQGPLNGPGAIVSLRLLANMFQPDLIQLISDSLEYMVDLVDSCKESGVKGVQNAYTAFLLNVAVYLQNITNPSFSLAMKVASQAAFCVAAFKDSSNSTCVIHALLAIGTLRRESLIKPVDISRMLPSNVLNSIIQRSGEESLIAKEVKSL